MALDFPSNPEVGDTHETAGNAYTWTGNRWMARAYTLEYPVPIYTNMVLTTPKDQAFGQPVASEPQVLDTQEKVNDFIAGVAEKGLKATNRAVDQIDFLQNSVGKGTWIRMDGLLGPDETPGPGEFWADSTEFREVKQLVFNDSGLPGLTNPGTLEGTRVGDYLTIQTNDTNSFGQYVIKEMATENVGKSGVIIRTFTVNLIRDARSQGELPPLTRCSVTVARPMSVIVQDTQPVVSTRGIFWYRETDDHLLISNYADGFTGEGEQWTDLTAGGDYLPLTGGTIDGMVTINKGPLLVNSAQVVELPDGGSLFTVLGSDNGDAILAINGAGSGKYFGKQNVPENIATVGHVSDSYLPLAGGTQHKMTGILYLGGNKIAGVADPERSDDAATRGFVEGQIAAIPKPELELSTRQRMYLQGFYPWRFAEGTNPSEGEWVAKTYDYNVVLDPKSWKMLYFSIVDAYGQDLAGKFLNHMDIDDYRPLQMWFAREDGTKICSYIGRMKCRDQNFEERFTVDMDASDKQLVTSPKWDSVSLEITRGEVIWIKCSAWGN